MNDPVDLTIVRVFMPDDLGNDDTHDRPAEFWVAAVPRENAVAAVLKRVPSHYTAELTDDFVGFQGTEILNLKQGDVSPLDFAT